jgi:hypothetical protein
MKSIASSPPCAILWLRIELRGLTLIPFPELDSCQYLFLDELCERGSNSLRVVVREARSSRKAVPVNVAGQSLGVAYPIKPDCSSSIYEITWPKYVTYQVRNETYAVADASDETSIGRLMKLYSASHFLEYVQRQTWAGPEFPGPLLHYCLICSDHIIDVVSDQKPGVRRLWP